MSDFTVSIRCSNASFDKSPGSEIARILHDLANSVDGLDVEELNGLWALLDLEGRAVGRAGISA